MGTERKEKMDLDNEKRRQNLIEEQVSRKILFIFLL